MVQHKTFAFTQYANKDVIFPIMSGRRISSGREGKLSALKRSSYEFGRIAIMYNTLKLYKRLKMRGKKKPNESSKVFIISFKYQIFLMPTMIIECFLQMV